jgi:hypothetical protein
MPSTSSSPTVDPQLCDAFPEFCERTATFALGRIAGQLDEEQMRSMRIVLHDAIYTFFHAAAHASKLDCAAEFLRKYMGQAVTEPLRGRPLPAYRARLKVQATEPPAGKPDWGWVSGAVAQLCVEALAGHLNDERALQAIADGVCTAGMAKGNKSFQIFISRTVPRMHRRPRPLPCYADLCREEQANTAASAHRGLKGQSRRIPADRGTAGGTGFFWPQLAGSNR